MILFTRKIAIFNVSASLIDTTDVVMMMLADSAGWLAKLDGKLDGWLAGLAGRAGRLNGQLVRCFSTLLQIIRYLELPQEV